MQRKFITIQTLDEDGEVIAEELVEIFELKAWLNEQDEPASHLNEVAQWDDIDTKVAEVFAKYGEITC